MRRPPTALPALALLLLALTGCLTHTRRVALQPVTPNLRTATLEQLVQQVDEEARRIRSLDATVDIAASVGGARRGSVTDYTEIRGYLFERDPDMLRIEGLVPVVRNVAFDMVSEGGRFTLLIPPKNKAIVGSGEVATPSASPLENLRPHVIFDALLLHEVHPDEIPFLLVGHQDVRDPKTRRTYQQPNYILNVVRRKQNGREWYLHRAVRFSRIDLLPYEQDIYDEQGILATKALYSNYQTYDGIPFPSVIRISRPKEEYEIQISIVKLTMNPPLGPEKFQLQIPPGTQVQELK